MRFQRPGGRKRIVASDGSVIVPNSKPQPDRTLIKALARAWRWQRLLDDGLCSSVIEISDAGGSTTAISAEFCAGAARARRR
jgi:hypothetical protein